jgi:hypothetical protein
VPITTNFLTSDRIQLARAYYNIFLDKRSYLASPYYYILLNQ